MYNARKGILVPTAMVFALWAFSTVIYYNSWRIMDPALCFYVGNVSAAVMGLTLLLGTCVLYGVLYFRGVGLGMRILASSLTPLAWIAKEVYRVGEFFTLAESLYYALCPVYVGITAGIVMLLGITELICRSRDRRNRFRRVRVWSPGPVLSICYGIFWLCVTLLWGAGMPWFYLYVEGYKALFM